MRPAEVSVVRVLSDFARVVRRQHVRWYVFGAHALVLRGLPRATADVDVTVLLEDRPTSAFADALVRGGFELRVPSPGFVAATRVLPIVHRASRLPVDVVLGGPGLEERFAEAAEPIRVGRVAVPVAAPVHLVLMKLIAARPKDLEDAVSLMRADPASDSAELDALAEELASALGEDDVLRNLRAVRRRARATNRAGG